MTVDGWVAVGLWFCFVTCSVKKSDGFIIQGVSACTFGNMLYGDLWEHVTYTAFKNEIMVTMMSQF